VAFASVAAAFSEGFDQPAAGPLQWLGDALGVVAGILWGATTLAIRATRLATAAPEKTLAYQLVVSALVLGIAAPLVGETWPARVSALSMGSMFFQTVIVTFASYLAWFWLVRHYPATRISAFTLLTPMAGLAFGVLLLGEPLTARLMIAMAGVALGLLLINRR
jgi:drug/metabolite transporter (DMT)-like permease